MQDVGTPDVNGVAQCVVDDAVIIPVHFLS